MRQSLFLLSINPAITINKNECFYPLMGSTKQTSFRKDNVISASEIGQYHFCPMSWYLQRCGYRPKSKSLEIGKEKHVELGKVMYYAQKNVRKSKILAYSGYFLLFITLIFLLFEVIL